MTTKQNQSKNTNTWLVIIAAFVIATTPIIFKLAIIQAQKSYYSNIKAILSLNWAENSPILDAIKNSVAHIDKMYLKNALKNMYCVLTEFAFLVTITLIVYNKSTKIIMKELKIDLSIETAIAALPCINAIKIFYTQLKHDILNIASNNPLTEIFILTIILFSSSLYFFMSPVYVLNIITWLFYSIPIFYQEFLYNPNSFFLKNSWIPLSKRQNTSKKLIDCIDKVCTHFGISPLKIYFSDKESIGAAAFRNIKDYGICIKEGALRTLGTNQIISLLLHEIGHIRHRDLLWMNGARAVLYTLRTIIILLVASFINGRVKKLYASVLVYYIDKALMNLIDVAIIAFLCFPSEYRADNLAYYYGYAVDDIEYFKTAGRLDKGVLQEYSDLFGYAVGLSHPSNAKRIKNAEKYIDIPKNKFWEEREREYSLKD